MENHMAPGLQNPTVGAVQHITGWVLSGRLEPVCPSGHNLGSTIKDAKPIAAEADM